MSTGYRPPSREPKGTWARHLHAFRKEHGWSQTRAFDEWREGLGFGARSRSAYIAIDMGDRPPTPDEAGFLISVVGEPTDVTPEPAEATQAPDALVSAISLLVEEIRAERAERQEWERSFVEAIRELARLDTPRVGPAPALLGDVRR